MDDGSNLDICRVCRSEGTPDRALFHPCICTGSIKWIHQECLMQWMRYSRKEYCELCSHRFSFTPIYSPDMPRRLPIRDVAKGLLSSVDTAVKYWLHFTLVAIAWLGIVPLTACRIYRSLFTGSVESVLTLPLDLLSTHNIPSDVFHGCFVVTCTLFAFIGIVWLREQILHGGGPEWLDRDAVGQPINVQQAPPEENLNEDNLNNNPQDDNNNGNINENLRQFGDQLEPIQEAAIEAEAPIGDLPPEPIGEPPPPIEEVLVDQDDGDNGGHDEGNWNPIEWDRAAEELTWERLLGLDGSLVFLEHVFWVVSLNTLFILVFAFCPYHIGHFAIVSIGMLDQTVGTHFEGLLTTLCGYCIIGVVLVMLHTLASLLGFRRSKRVLGLCYVIVKVSLLSVIEIGVLPLICGWWLDICSLSMFDATLKDRETSFRLAPGTSMFIHWLVGMVYVYYFASFILLLREVLRPGVLWFMINLNDPDFSPIQEMIHLSIPHHIRRLVASSVIFGTAVMLMLWLPVKILRSVWSSFLPYNVALQTETQVSELSLELLLLQVILPALLEQSHTRTWMKALVRAWCGVVSWVLGIHSYLLGDDIRVEDNNAAAVNQNNENQEQQNVFNGGLGAAHQALIPREGPIGFQPYHRPAWFHARIAGLLISVCISLVIASLAALTLPVWLGRRVMTVWLVGAPPPSPSVAEPGVSAEESPTVRVHELYTAACGTYLCWLTARAISILSWWLPQGRAAIATRIRQWCMIGVKSIIAFSVLLGVIPLLFGLLLEIVVVVPMRVPLDQTPVLFIWQDWALGVLYTKIACAVIMMGPDWKMRRAIERVYRDGIRNMHLKFILQDLALPVIRTLGLALAVPYCVAYDVVPSLVSNAQLKNVIARRLYPCLLVATGVTAIVTFQIRQFRKLYEHIKNDKYLVGKRLVNYDHRRTQSTQTNSLTTK